MRLRVLEAICVGEYDLSSQSGDVKNHNLTHGPGSIAALGKHGHHTMTGLPALHAVMKPVTIVRWRCCCCCQSWRFRCCCFRRCRCCYRCHRCCRCSPGTAAAAHAAAAAAAAPNQHLRQTLFAGGFSLCRIGTSSYRPSQMSDLLVKPRIITKRFRCIIKLISLELMRLASHTSSLNSSATWPHTKQKITS